MNHPAPPIASHEQWLKEAAILINKLVLLAGAQTLTLDGPVEDRITDADIDALEARLLAHLRAVPVVAPAEPVAWLHEVTEPEDQQAGRAHSLLSRQPDNPWSHWREDYKGRCTFKSTPLYTAPPKESPSAPAAPSEQEQFAAKRANGVALPDGGKTE